MAAGGVSRLARAALLRGSGFLIFLGAAVGRRSGRFGRRGRRCRGSDLRQSSPAAASGRTPAARCPRPAGAAPSGPVADRRGRCRAPRLRPAPAASPGLCRLSDRALRGRGAPRFREPDEPVARFPPGGHRGGRRHARPLPRHRAAGRGAAGGGGSAVRSRHRGKREPWLSFCSPSRRLFLGQSCSGWCACCAGRPRSTASWRHSSSAPAASRSPAAVASDRGGRRGRCGARPGAARGFCNRRFRHRCRPAG